MSYRYYTQQNNERLSSNIQFFNECKNKVLTAKTFHWLLAILCQLEIDVRKEIVDNRTKGLKCSKTSLEFITLSLEKINEEIDAVLEPKILNLYSEQFKTEFIELEYLIRKSRQEESKRIGEVFAEKRKKREQFINENWDQIYAKTLDFKRQAISEYGGEGQ